MEKKQPPESMFSTVFFKFFSQTLPRLTAVVFPVAVAMATLPLSGAETTADGVEVVGGNRENLRELRELDRQLCTLFRITSRRSPIQCRVVCSEEIPPGALRFGVRKNLWQIEIHPDVSRWRQSFALRRQLLGYLFAAKGGVLPREADYFPDWVVAGIEARMNAAESSERLLGSNRFFPVLRYGCRTGRQPDFRILMSLHAEKMPAAVRVWFDELSRLFLETAAAVSTPTDNALLDYVMLKLTGKGSESEGYAATLRRVFLAASGKIPPGRFRENWEALSEDEKIQRFLEYSADRAACNVYFPRPAAWTAEEFRRVRNLSYPVLDSEGKPTGEERSLQLEGMPGFLVTRPDATALKLRKIGELNLALPGAAPEIARSILRLTDAIRALPEVRSDTMPMAEETFLKAIAEVEDVLCRISLREAWFEAEAEKFQSPFEIHRVELETAAAPDAVLSEAAEKYVERVERIYLDE